MNKRTKGFGIKKRQATDEANEIDNKQRAGRRRLLGVLGVGGSAAFLPPSWRRPVVQSVLLPAHAQTSNSEPLPPQLLDCNASVELIRPPFSVIGCQQDSVVQTTVSGSISGAGDLSGVTVNVQSSLSIASNPIVSFSTTTDATGNYTATPSGGQGHVICTVGSVADDAGSTCDNLGTTFTVTTTATPVGFPDQVAQCTATFTCADVQALHEGGNQDQEERG